MIRDLLKDKSRIYLDGAMGTNLMKINNKKLANMEVFNFTNPDSVKQVHRDYLLAGSNVILTNTFGANPIRLKDTNIDPRESIVRAIDIAQNAVDSVGSSKRYIALDIGPLGKEIDETGISRERAYEIFAVQAELGEKNGCDLISIETMYSLKELSIALRAVKENTKIPVFATFVLGKDFRLYSGESVEDIVRVLEGFRVDALGINCAFGSFEAIEVMDKLGRLTNIPLICKPNAGHISKKNTREIISEDFAHHMKIINEKGVNILGGCCGTDRSYIKRMIEECEK